MAVLIANGKQAYTDGAGLPLVGGRLYTYAAGTDTPMPTYTDASGTVAQTNPVILDARGEAAIFWNGTYKVVLKDAFDVTIWTVNNVIATAIDATLRPDLALRTGGDLIGLTNANGDLITLSQALAGFPLYASSLYPLVNFSLDQTLVIQAFMDLCVTLRRQGVWDIPSAIYSSQRTIPSKLRLAVRAGCSLKYNGPAATADGQYTMKIAAGGDVQIIGETQGEWFIEGGADDPNMAAIGGEGNIADVKIEDLRTLRMKHTVANPTMDYNVATGFNGPTRWRLRRGGHTYDTTTAQTTHGVAFIYANSCSAEDMTFIRGPGGVQAWGGNANPAANGAIANARKCSDIQFRNIKAYNVGGCFVFVSMVDYGGAWDCYGDGAGDVGFDHEGCGSDTSGGFSFYNCDGRNAVNGVVTTFFFNRGGGFFNCTTHQNSPSQPNGAAVNPSQTTDNRDFILHGGKHTAGAGGIGSMSLYSAVANTDIQGGNYYNVAINLNALNNFRARVNGVHMTLPYAAPSAIAAIGASGFNGLGAFATISNCRIVSLAAQPAGSAAVGMSHGDFNNNTGGTVKDCEITGFPLDISFVDASANPGTRGIWKSIRNELGAKLVSLTSNGHTGSTYYGGGTSYGLYDGAAV